MMASLRTDLSKKSKPAMVCGMLPLAKSEIFHNFDKCNSSTNNSEACIAMRYLPALIGGCVKFKASHAWARVQWLFQVMRSGKLKFAKTTRSTASRWLAILLGVAMGK